VFGLILAWIPLCVYDVGARPYRPAEVLRLGTQALVDRGARDMGDVADGFRRVIVFATRNWKLSRTLCTQSDLACGGISR
jgi:hypothetical protein